MSSKLHDTTDIDGVVLLDKPVGLSSNAALQRLRKHLGRPKCGHAGSLDPLASGMLPICIGQATKFISFLLAANKSYRVTAKLGIQTSTGDAEGEIINQQTVTAITREELEKLCQSFVGESQQMPPMHSALKHNGQPLYKYARQGVEIERKARTITIHSLEILSFKDDELTFDVSCSKGTYIRSLVEDIGEKLGCGAYVSFLRRLNVGDFNEQDMQALDALTDEPDSTKLLPVDVLLSHLPMCTLSEQEILALQQGRLARYEHNNLQGLTRIYCDLGQFIGLAETLPDNTLKAKRLMAYQSSELDKKA